MMKRRNLLLGLMAAPAIIRTPGLLMPVRRLSAAVIDPADINGIIAELPDGARWAADPRITYWAEGSIRVVSKRSIILSGAQVVIRERDACFRIKDCKKVQFHRFMISDATSPTTFAL